MTGEHPTHIPAENPFSSQDGKLPPEPTAKFVERFLGKSRSGQLKESGTSELVADEDRRAAEEENAIAQQAEAAERSALYEDERKALSGFFGREVDIPELPQEITAERRQEWRELGFELHYLPRVELTENEPGLKVPPKFDILMTVQPHEVDSFGPEGPEQLSPLELPGCWVLIDARQKPDFTDGTQRYPNDEQIEAALGGSRFGKSWDELNERPTVTKLAEILKVDPSQVRLVRAVEFNVLGNLYHPEWGATSTYEWFEDSANNDLKRLCGGGSGGGGLAYIGSNYPDDSGKNIGFRPLVSFPNTASHA